MTASPASHRSAWLRRGILACAVLALPACAVGPDYQRPAAPAQEGWKEAPPGWRPGAPRDDAERGPWWTVFGDADLDALEAQVAVSNQSLLAAEAAYRGARAAAAAANSAFLPTITANAGAERTGRGSAQDGGGRIANQFTAGIGASWTLDLWGRLRRAAESAQAATEASGADLAAARLSLQAVLATDYIRLRGYDRLISLLERTVAADDRALQIASHQHDAGVVSLADVIQARTQVEAVRAQVFDATLQRAQLEHAIAVLIGKPPGTFSLAATGDLPTIPAIPGDMPSALLERRPDLAGAERRVAAANAQIGVATAAYYPDLTLSASYGYGSSTLSTLFDLPNRVWSLGGQVVGTLFDGGVRSAQVEAARAGWEQQVALYRQAVLTAFQQVEDGLAAQRILADQATVEARAVASAREASRLVLNQYQAGTIAYTAVISVQNTEIDSERAALTVEQDRLVAAVNLIEALGGGWDARR